MADYTGGYRNIRKKGSSGEVTQSMAPIENVLNLKKTVLTKTGYPNAIDTSFSELVTPPPPLEETISVEQFFDLYNSIFYDIPAEGDVNSHEFLIKTSSEYIGFEDENELIKLLQAEIANLRQELLANQQQLADFTKLIPEAPEIEIPEISIPEEPEAVEVPTPQSPPTPSPPTNEERVITDFQKFPKSTVGKRAKRLNLNKKFIRQVKRDNNL